MVYWDAPCSSRWGCRRHSAPASTTPQSTRSNGFSKTCPNSALLKKASRRKEVRLREDHRHKSRLYSQKGALPEKGKVIPTMKLSVPGSTNLRVRDGKRTENLDERSPFFTVRVTVLLTRIFSVLYRRAGGLRRDTLGTFPTIGLAQARSMAREALAETAPIRDPARRKIGGTYVLTNLPEPHKAVRSPMVASCVRHLHCLESVLSACGAIGA